MSPQCLSKLKSVDKSNSCDSLAWAHGVETQRAREELARSNTVVGTGYLEHYSTNEQDVWSLE